MCPERGCVTARDLPSVVVLYTYDGPRGSMLFPLDGAYPKPSSLFSLGRRRGGSVRDTRCGVVSDVHFSKRGECV